MTDRYYCATAARHRDDPLAGSAAPARRWLLIEEAGPWATTALDSRSIPSVVADALHQAAISVGGRALLIRRPGRRRRAVEQAWAVVDSGGRQHWGRWTEPEDLLQAAQAMVAGPEGFSASVPLGADEHHGPVLLVCTHSLHDVCCAVRGRPVASALTATWPDETWECSHIGGDRFAANVLVLPDGYCYGRLDATSAPRVVRDHLEGRVDPEHLRGPSTQPPAAQAAIAEAIRRLGAAGPHDLSVLSHRESSPGTWTVRLAGSGSMPALIEARVDRTTGPRAQLTCRATRESAAYVYDVTALEVISSPD